MFDGNRKQRRAAIGRGRVKPALRFERHAQHQQGDEMACSCGRRWPVGESHP